eukprot:scaffold129867_cov48-Phaeocystis_antarctica.AAC.2
MHVLALPSSAAPPTGPLDATGWTDAAGLRLTAAPLVANAGCKDPDVPAAPAAPVATAEEAEEAAEAEKRWAYGWALEASTAPVPPP